MSMTIQEAILHNLITEVLPEAKERRDRVAKHLGTEGEIYKSLVEHVAEVEKDIEELTTLSSK